MLPGDIKKKKAELQLGKRSFLRKRAQKKSCASPYSTTSKGKGSPGRLGAG